MKTSKRTFKMTFTEPVLGSANNNKKVYEEFTASKAPTLAAAQEELDALGVAQEIEKERTVFPRENGEVFMWDYQLRGFFKENFGVLAELGDIKISKWIYKRAVDALLFVGPRRIFILNAEGKRIGGALEDLQRPMRVTTMQGDRVCLANSELLPAGSNIQFEVTLLSGNNPKTKLAVLEDKDLDNALDYGAVKGFGQWRGGGWGRFTWEEVKR